MKHPAIADAAIIEASKMLMPKSALATIPISTLAKMQVADPINEIPPDNPRGISVSETISITFPLVFEPTAAATLSLRDSAIAAQ